ncbi:pikachurin-like [Ornithodoros turicata]|uniref:pikachurin-like n=1 Tax=Ornithodoros turicata TaxID=34597 RepID=UPI00313877A0
MPPPPYRPKMAPRLITVLLGAALLLRTQAAVVAAAAENVGFEAAFQGECRVDGPCQQICFDLHDGTFECGCSTGYKLSTNGYGCDPLEANESVPLSPEETNNSTDNSSKKVPGSSEAPTTPGVHENMQQVVRRRTHAPLEAGDSNYENRIDELFDEDDLNLKPPDRKRLSLSPRPSEATGASLLDQDGADDDPEEGDARKRQDNADRYELLNTVTVTTTPTSKTSREVLQYDASSCDELLCSKEGRCVQDDVRGGVRCACRLGTTGPFCDEEVEVRYPRFGGSSYLSLPVLKNAHRLMQITLQFRPESHDAILLYSGETPELVGDYFAVLLDKGFVEFRFDCGMGQGILRSDQPAVLNSWNTLTVYRDRWDAWMQLNSGHQVQGRSKGLFSRITFRLNVYLGGSPNASLVSGRIGAQEGFQGCVRYLEINGKRYDFRPESQGDAVDGADIEECGGDVCSRMQCQNGGQCVTTSPDRGVCLCALGFAGPTCETRVDIVVPSFNGSSFLRFPGLGNDHLSFVELKMVVKPLSPHGVFLYNGCKMDGTGDFLALQMVNGFVECSFDLGTGTAVIRSEEPVALGEWHTVWMSRTGRLGSLQVDDQDRVDVEAPGAFSQLSLPLNLYMGGVPDVRETAQGAAIAQSFVGCIQEVSLNGRPVLLMQESLSGVNVGNCVHPCVTGPCYNGGACQPKMDSYSCHCKLGYAGSNCQTEVGEAIAEPMLGGASYLHYTSDDIMKRVRGDRLDVQIRFRSFSSHGLLFWAGERDYRPSADFVSLGLERGLAAFRYNLGSGEALVVANYSRLDDGRWHSLRVTRTHADGTLAVDDGPVLRVVAPGKLRQLNVDSGFYIGGVNDISHVTRGRYRSGLVGCVANVTLATDLHVRLVSHATTGINVQPCV